MGLRVHIQKVSDAGSLHVSPRLGVVGGGVVVVGQDDRRLLMLLLLLNQANHGSVLGLSTVMTADNLARHGVVLALHARTLGRGRALQGSDLLTNLLATVAGTELLSCLGNILLAAHVGALGNGIATISLAHVINAAVASAVAAAGNVLMATARAGAGVGVRLVAVGRVLLLGIGNFVVVAVAVAGILRLLLLLLRVLLDVFSVHDKLGRINARLDEDGLFFVARDLFVVLVDVLFAVAVGCQFGGAAAVRAFGGDSFAKRLMRRSFHDCEGEWMMMDLKKGERVLTAVGESYFVFVLKKID